MEPISKQSKTVLGTFLESVDAPSSAPPAPITAAPAPAAPAAPIAAGEPLTLSSVLRFLISTQDQQVSIADIAIGLGASTVEAADVVQKMAYSGLVTVDGAPGREAVHLTEQGRGLTSVA